MYDSRIVDAARSWIGTRFHHQGRLKKSHNHKGGVDCLGLLVGVAGELDLKTPDGIAITDFDITDYSHHPDTDNLKTILNNILNTKTKNDIQPGDVLILEVDSNPQHLGIVSNYNKSLGLIHAYAPARGVIEHALDECWQARVSAVFSIN